MIKEILNKFNIEGELINITENHSGNINKTFVATFKRKDGTHSDVKWTIEETDSVCRQYDVKSKVETYGKKYDHYKFSISLSFNIFLFKLS